MVADWDCRRHTPHQPPRPLNRRRPRTTFRVRIVTKLPRRADCRCASLFSGGRRNAPRQPHSLSAQSGCLMRGAPHGIRVSNVGRGRAACPSRRRLDSALYREGARPLALAGRRSQGRRALPNRVATMGQATGAGVAGHYRLASPRGFDLTPAPQNDTPPTKRRGVNVPIDLNSAS